MNSGKRYPLDELMACCPEVEEAQSVEVGDFRVRPDFGLPEPDEWFPTYPIVGMAVPLEIALSKTTRKLIEEGKPPETNDRWSELFRLGKVLRAARRHLEQLGHEVEGGSEAAEIRLLSQFIERSAIKGGNTDLALKKYWRPEPCGETELCELLLKRNLRERALQLGLVKQPHPLGDWAHSMSEGDWWVTNNKTVEVVVFSALMKKSAHEGRPITSHRRRFLRYMAELGFFEPVSVHEMQKLMLDLLPYAFSQNANGAKSRKHITASKAGSCTDFAALKLNEDQMDVVPAIAFRNGTYLLSSGRLVPHNPAYKLTWAVNANYSAVVDCPPMMRAFIASSFGSEWERIIQIVLRYMVDPEIKCSRILIILGPSGSGKGTLERLIEKLFPRSCISVITSGFADINHPDKIRQFVSGKRLLTFPDLQGKQLGVGTLYALTDGGMLTGRTLHESDAEAAEPFTGRVVLCSTQPPLMDDAGNGLTRRMLVLPTCRPAGQKPDQDLDEKLEAELGLIVSWALRASRSEVKELLASGDPGGLLREAAMDAEVGMDPIRSFINRCLVPMQSDHLPKESDLFTAYKAFCEDQNHRPTSQRTFCTRLGNALPHLKSSRRSVPGSNSGAKAPSVFFGFQVAKGLVSGPGMTFNPKINADKYVESGYTMVHNHRPQEPNVEVVFATCCGNPDINKPCSDTLKTSGTAH